MAMSFTCCFICLVLVVVDATHQNLVMPLATDDGLNIAFLEGGSFETNHTTNKTVVNKCDAFFSRYIRFAGEFAQCELKNSRPFRMCSQCVKEHEIAAVTYRNFMKDADLKDCRLNYVKGDRVQILPSMNTYIEYMWINSACQTCTKDVHVNHYTGVVNFTIPERITLFMELFQNLSLCMNTTLEDGNFELLKTQGPDNTSVCTKCLDQYSRLNGLYGSMSSSLDGNVCMDIVDRMNYTRLIWSGKYNCSCRWGDSHPVIIIAVIIGVLPFAFYGSLRYKGKEKKSKVFRQKRLLASTSTHLGSQSVSNLTPSTSST